MFNDFQTEVSGFHPCVEKERFFSDGDCQTMKINKSDQCTQSSNVVVRSVQASPEQISVISNSEVPYNSENLNNFLKKVLPLLEVELADSINTEDNFDKEFSSEGCESILNYNGLETSESVECKEFFIESKFCENQIISNLTWNSTGMILAVGTSESSHESWCNHEASVYLYNTGSPKLEKSLPVNQLRTLSCVTALQFHPYTPSILAAGLYSGEICIWDLTSEEEILLTKVKQNCDVEHHTDAVTSILWREDNNGIRLITAGRDGKIIFWKVTISNLTYKADEKFIIPAQHMTSVPSTLTAFLEVNSIGFWPNKEFDFIVAASNQIFHCSARIANFVNMWPKHKDPVVMNYKPHNGVATCVSCLPQSDIFATSGIDWEIHISKSEVSTPLYIINSNHPVMGVDWRSTTCIASWGNSSEIKLHKLNAETKNLISTSGYKANENISAVAFNLKRSGKIAIGIKTGVVFLNEDILIIKQDLLPT